jgi:ATP-dependent Lon protease
MTIILDDLDKKLIDNFRGFVVKKDLVRQLKLGANVPVFVLEYLLANSCSTFDEEQMWARLLNSNIKQANIKDALVVAHEKLLLGGIWAIMDIEYDPEIKIGNKSYPFIIRNIKPIQLASFDMFTRDEWIDVLVRSIGIEPSSEGVDKRMKMLLISRLIPLIEPNFNLIELGPRMTGKSYVYKEITPYAILLSGGQATVPQLFINNTTRKIGLVGNWDTVAFDEVAGIHFKDKAGIPILKDYMESGILPF